MPRFFFNIHDGISIPDREGTDLPDWQAARLEAIRVAGQVLRDDAKRLSIGESWHMDVTDTTGHVLFRLDFRVMDAPATAR